VDPGLAGEFGGAQLGQHAATAQGTFTIALRLEGGGKFPNHTLETWLLVAVWNHESVNIG
jgi:hypothetical protein